jgi:hypothetical protein
MKLVLIALVVGSCAWGQHSAGSRLGGTHATRGPGVTHFVAPPPVAHPVHSATVIVPYPVFYGGFYYTDPSAAYGNTPAGAPAPAGSYYDDGSNGAPGQPVVVLNQSFGPEGGNPVPPDYSNMQQPGAAGPTRPDDEPTVYLIAMTDHTILPAIAYWVDGDTLTYITADADQNRVSLSLVDREFSQKLNADRGVEFRLPAPKNP